MEKNKKGMVFGVFDGLHEGHRFFLNSASEQCETLIVVVARDDASSALKGRKPKYDFDERMQALFSFNSSWVGVAGDSVQGEWSALKTYRPDMVFLGHDQKAIADEFIKMGIQFSCIDSHHPEEFKSSLLHHAEAG